MSAALCDTSSRLCKIKSALVKRAIPRSSYVSRELELIFLGLGSLNVDARSNSDPADKLLANEVPDLNLELVAVLLNVYVDGKTMIC